MWVTGCVCRGNGRQDEGSGERGWGGVIAYVAGVGVGVGEYNIHTR